MICTDCPQFNEEKNYCTVHDAYISPEKVMADLPCSFYQEEKPTRTHNVGSSDYSTHKIQPWDIWIEYKLNPFDADIVKRILRKKSEKGMTETESRKLDYQKIIHICQERIRQIDEGIEL